MYFDIAMPSTLFLVTVVAVFLERKAEGKLKGVFEERKFRARDAALLVAAIGVTISIAIFIPQTAFVTMFLFAYCMLLFVVTYIFSDFQKSQARLFCFIFLLITFSLATLSLFNFGVNKMIAYGGLALFCLFCLTFLALLYDEWRGSTKERWYFAALTPSLFLVLYLFYSRTPLWFPYLLNIYGIIFAVLITLYLGSLFTWRTMLVFIGFLTIMDIILVLYTGTMISAARHASALRLPVLISVPTIPAITSEWGTIYMSLGLGDFFFAGLIGTQSFKKYGKRFALLSITAMTVSFFIFEALILNYEIAAFPGTLMIICGWLPLALFKELKKMTAS